MNVDIVYVKDNAALIYINNKFCTSAKCDENGFDMFVDGFIAGVDFSTEEAVSVDKHSVTNYRVLLNPPKELESCLYARYRD